MARLNALAADEARRVGATGGTDVTGFGLLGHLLAMVQASGVDAEVAAQDVPTLADVRELTIAGYVPGGTARNLAHVRGSLDAPGVDEVSLTILADAQTSGGLLFGTSPDRAAEAVAALRESGHEAAVVGRVVEGTGRITVTP
jgi:selenide,water dikinase